MRILANMVVRNEADRYLYSCLQQLTVQVDGVAVYDDGSTDDTPLVASDLGALVATQKDSSLAFSINESAARQAAWDWMEESLLPEDGDWILLIDADEYLDERPGELRSVAEDTDADGVIMPIHEVFGVSTDGCPLVRTDGLWNTISGLRFVRWRPGGHIPEKSLACGSAPSYALHSMLSVERPAILHYGYVKPEDRHSKYERYAGREGHNPEHVRSILSVPTLQRYDDQ